VKIATGAMDFQIPILPFLFRRQLPLYKKVAKAAAGGAEDELTEFWIRNRIVCSLNRILGSKFSLDFGLQDFFE
jgi:hypothetical protein